MPDFTIESVLICDEVRKEVTNKDIIIGVYGGALLIPSFPAQAPLAVWMEIIAHTIGRHEIELKIEIAGKPGGVGIKFVLDMTGIDDPITMATPQFIIPFLEPGEVVVSIKSARDEAWRPIKTKRVIVGQPAPASIMQVIQDPTLGPIPPSPTSSPPPSGQSPPDAPETAPRASRRRPSTRRTGRTPEPE
jgi:hypothetical protein